MKQISAAFTLNSLNEELSKDEQEVMINEALLVEQSKKMLELSKSHMSELNADVKFIQHF